MLQVLSADWCSACKVVKKFLDANSIPYQERDIENEPDAYEIIERLDLRSIPVIYLDDDNFVVGMDAAKILELAKK